MKDSFQLVTLLPALPPPFSPVYSPPRSQGDPFKTSFTVAVSCSKSSGDISSHSRQNPKSSPQFTRLSMTPGTLLPFKVVSCHSAHLTCSSHTGLWAISRQARSGLRPRNAVPSARPGPWQAHGSLLPFIQCSAQTPLIREVLPSHTSQNSTTLPLYPASSQPELALPPRDTRL